MMEKNKAKEVTMIVNRMIVNRINKCENFLESLQGRSYNDEFAIYYRGIETCELEEDVLQMIIKHYEDELVKLNKSLNNL